jgi:hypothetical protein
LKELAKNGGMLTTFSVHISHLFPVIDVLLFRIVKTVKKYLANTRPKIGRQQTEVR